METMEEQEVVVKARKLGGSLVVRIPKEVVEEEGITAGSSVKLKIKKLKKSWFGALRGVGSFTKEDEFDEH
jgi:antitoxin component of MazEF toxin-antitoxin module